MTVARIYIMHARAGQGTALRSALDALVAGVRQIEGNTGVEFLADRGNAERFVFIEKWVSQEAHETALAGERPAGLDAVMGASDPSLSHGAYYDYVQAI